MSVADKSLGAELGVGEICLNWQGKQYRLTHESVMKAFDRAPIGDIVGPHARYYLEMDGDMKSVESVFREIVPILKESVSPKQAILIAEIFRSLGFPVLDRREK